MKWIVSLLLATLIAQRPAAHAEDPRPDEASGVETEDSTPVQHELLWVPRSIVFVPRLVIWGASQPVRGGAWAFEKSGLRAWFFGPAGNYSIFPLAMYQSRYGFTAGARFDHYDLFGEHEYLKLRAMGGGRFRQAYEADLRSGDRFGPVTLELDARYEVLPRERFFGIGNTANNEVEFREDALRNVLAFEINLGGDFYTRTSGTLMVRELDGPVPMEGFEDGVDNIYGEQELAYDSRRPASPYQSTALDGDGWYITGYVGIARGIDGDRSAFARYGGEIQKYFDLYEGSRTLALRVLAQSVVGDEDISFIDLPRLGGSEYLRGYVAGRFRDRAMALASIEYAWDIGNYLSAYTFVDAGRVYHSLADTTFQDLRAGFGGGVELHTWKTFLMRLQLAGSRDGDVLLEVALSPSLGVRRRERGRF
jgi:hypothetical protein